MQLKGYNGGYIYIYDIITHKLQITTRSGVCTILHFKIPNEN